MQRNSYSIWFQCGGLNKRVMQAIKKKGKINKFPPKVSGQPFLLTTHSLFFPFLHTRHWPKSTSRDRAAHTLSDTRLFLSRSCRNTALTLKPSLCLLWRGCLSASWSDSGGEGGGSCFNGDKVLAYHGYLQLPSFELTEVMPAFSSLSRWQPSFYLRIFSRVQDGNTSTSQRCLFLGI